MRRENTPTQLHGQDHHFAHRFALLDSSPHPCALPMELPATGFDRPGAPELLTRKIPAREGIHILDLANS